MTRYDWLLFLHVLSAVVLVGSLAALWTLVAATRPAAPVLGPESAERFGRVAGPAVGIGLLGTLGFGLALAVDLDAYDLVDGWILASLALWALAGWSGSRSGQEFRRDPVGRRTAAIRLQALSSLAALTILALMIWKPGT